MTETILVTGASGKLGGAVIRHLLDSQGVAPSRIVAGSRDPNKLADLAALGVAVRNVDFDNPEGLETAFAGVGTVLIISTDVLDGADTRLRQHRTAVAAAKKAGAARIAYTSIANADTSKVSFAPDHSGTEAAIKASGLAYLIFRNSWYQENLFMSLPQALKTGQWYTSSSQGGTAFVARDDIAAAIAGALANPPAGGVTYTLTGSEALTKDEIAGLAGEILGKPIQVVHLGDEQLAGGMKAAGVPEAIVPMLVSFDTATRAGDLATVTADVTALSGRQPLPVRDFLAASKAALLA
ncbi:MAG: NAD(P)H-binding protein [Rhizobiaceae bacterium]|nr:MAG: NAD(P)H-binding protein [Rhizobiaceae bacterium]CAG1014477.1 NAD(P)H dehydrogenase (quinone) [Rhizobiaceae bacterium]